MREEGVTSDPTSTVTFFPVVIAGVTKSFYIMVLCVETTIVRCRESVTDNKE